MSKAVLVMEMPERCDKCIFHYNTYDDCDNYVDKCMVLNNETIDGYRDKYDYCPLKPVPDKLEYGYGCNSLQYSDGWNAFRELLLEDKY